MTPARLAQLGRFLYGARWKGPLARALGIQVRVVQRWATGQRVIPAHVEGEIKALIAAVQS